MRRLQKAIVIGITVGALGAALRPSTIGLRLEEDVGLRWLFALRGPRKPPPDVAVVTIDKGSAQQLGLDVREWPPPRRVHAAVVRALAAHHVSAIAMDVRFEKQRSPGDDEDLADAIAKSGNVILAQRIDHVTVPGADVEIEQIHSPIDQFQKGAIGLALFPLPKGALTHFFWTFFETATGEVPTLPAVALQISALPSMDRFVALLDRAGVKALGLPGHVSSAPESRLLMEGLRNRLGKDQQAAARVLDVLEAGGDGTLGATERRLFTALVKLYAGNRMYYLNFYGPAGSIETIPFHELLQDEKGERFALKGRAVFVGEGASEIVTSAEQVDTYRTVYSTSDGVDLSGAEIAATAFANLLTDRPLRSVDAFLAFAILLSLGIVAGILGLLPRGTYAVAIVTVVDASYFGFGQFLFSRHALHVPVAIPVLIQFPLALFVGVFTRYRDVRKQVLVEIDPNAPSREFEGVCLFTDIEDSMGLTKDMAANGIAPLLSEYFDMLRERVERRAGKVVDRAGDSSVNLWEPKGRGQQNVDKEARLNACLAAIEIRDAVDRFNERHEPTRLRTRFGLHADRVVFAPVSGRAQPTADLVPIAERIQSLNKSLRTTLLASGRVVHDLPELLLRPLGSIPLKGAGPTSVFEILGRKGMAAEIDSRLGEWFAAGLELIEHEYWLEAAKVFQQLSLDYPDDGPTAYWREKCEAHLVPGGDPGRSTAT